MRPGPAAAAPGTGEPVARIVITGISGRLGRLLAQRLHQDHEILGLDRRGMVRKPRDIEVFAYDIRRKKCEGVFRNRRVDVLVHLNIMHDFRRPQHELHSWNVIGTQRLLDYAARYDVGKVVFLSTANVYGARPDNPQFLAEDSPLMGGERFSEMGSLVAVDMLLSTFFWRRPDLETVVLRPAHIVGSVRNGPSLYLSMPVIPTVMGFDPVLQIVHEEDVVEALALAANAPVRGVFNVAGAGALPLSVLIRTLGRRSLPLPYPVLKALLTRAWEMGVTEMPAPELDFLRYPCLVDDRRARAELGYRPRRSLRETLDLIRSGDPYAERLSRHPDGR
ncbi:MAG: SDR family oxidoreductase [Deltaproteobacteria bacterium]|nr:SDR family oxidoreductase [Deltaproteobacteria bacterium]